MEKDKPIPGNGANSKRKSDSLVPDIGYLSFKRARLSHYTTKRMIFAGSIYGEYVAKGNTLLDFKQLMEASSHLYWIPTEDLIKLTYEFCLKSFIQPAEERLKLGISKCSSQAQTSLVKDAVDLIDKVCLDLGKRAPDEAARLANVKAKLLATLGGAGHNSSDFLTAYYNETKDTLNAAKALQERVKAQGFEEEDKLQKRVVDGIEEKMARAYELKAIFSRFNDWR